VEVCVVQQLDLEHKLAFEVRPKFFFSAFTRHWWTLVSGGASIPSTFVALFVSAWWAKVLWGCAAVLCVGFASYWVWRDQRELYVREATRNSKPELQLSIRRVWVRIAALNRLTSDLMKGLSKQFDMPDLAEPLQPFDVYVQFHMTNGTQVSTTIQEYQLKVGPSDNRIVGSYFRNLDGQRLPIEYVGFDSDGKSRPTVTKEPLKEDFAAELNSVPVEYCKGRLGWLRFSCSGIEPGAVTLNNVSLVAIDALGIGHEAKVETNAELKLEHLDI
jgi:hypothetical protein